MKPVEKKIFADTKSAKNGVACMFCHHLFETPSGTPVACDDCWKKMVANNEVEYDAELKAYFIKGSGIQKSPYKLKKQL